MRQRPLDHRVAPLAGTSVFAPSTTRAAVGPRILATRLLAALIAWSVAVAPVTAAEPPAAVAPAEAGGPDEPPSEPASEVEPEPELEAEPEPAAIQAPSGGGGARLAVVPVAIDGTVDAGADDRLTGTLRAGMARGAFSLVDPAAIAAIADGGCESKACVDALRQREGAEYVLRTKIKVDDRDYIVKLELVSTDNAEVVASSDERCDLCSLAEVGTLLEAQAAVLRRKLEDLIKGPPVIVVDTQPAGALVFIDNQLVGTSPMERTMIEGEHIVRVMLDGYVADEREVNLVAGVRESLDLTLRRTPETAKFRAIGWASLFTGLPVLGAGAALIAIHGQYRNCHGYYGKDSLDCADYVESRWGGAAAMAVGGALVAVGATLLVRTRNKSKSGRTRSKARASAGFGAGGALVRF